MLRFTCARVERDKFDVNVGLGFNFGAIYDLPADIELVYGGSVGFWLTRARDEYQTYHPLGGYGDNADWARERWLFTGPFIKLRWHGLEISYRGLMGIEAEEGYNFVSYGKTDGRVDEGLSFAYHSQLNLGYHFVIPRRQRY
ncbi:MAG: hypothetical protein LBU70_10035 [Chitinispirillales bacterium]|nr:hypothetical protein [Chitinispirillales bacterium]